MFSLWKIENCGKIGHCQFAYYGNESQIKNKFTADAHSSEILEALLADRAEDKRWNLNNRFRMRKPYLNKFHLKRLSQVSERR